MRDSDIVGFGVIVGMIILLMIVGVALMAGNIVNQLFAPAPSISGPLGAGTALAVFVLLGGKGLSLFLEML